MEQNTNSFVEGPIVCSSKKFGARGAIFFVEGFAYNKFSRKFGNFQTLKVPSYESFEPYGHDGWGVFVLLNLMMANFVRKVGY